MTFTVTLGNKVIGRHSEQCAETKYSIYYVIRFGKHNYYIRTQYRVFEYDFVGGRNGRYTRIPLYNELINEEIAKYHELKGKYGEKDEKIVLRNFRAWMEKRKEI